MRSLDIEIFNKAIPSVEYKRKVKESLHNSQRSHRKYIYMQEKTEDSYNRYSALPNLSIHLNKNKEFIKPKSQKKFINPKHKLQSILILINRQMTEERRQYFESISTEHAFVLKNNFKTHRTSRKSMNLCELCPEKCYIERLCSEDHSKAHESISMEQNSATSRREKSKRKCYLPKPTEHQPIQIKKTLKEENFTPWEFED